MLIAMAEETAPELAEANSAAQDMELEAVGSERDPKDGDDKGVDSAAPNGDANSKRAREEGAEEEEEEEDEEGEEDDAVSIKRQRVDWSVEEERLEKLGGGEEEAGGRVNLGAKEFGSSVEMFDYFYKILHYWPPNLNLNKVIIYFFCCLKLCLVAELRLCLCVCVFKCIICVLLLRNWRKR